MNSSTKIIVGDILVHGMGNSWRWEKLLRPIVCYVPRPYTDLIPEFMTNWHVGDGTILKGIVTF